MSDLIDRAKLKEAMCDRCNGCPPFGTYGSCWILRTIDLQPTVGTLKHGYWKPMAEDIFDCYKCSNCGGYEYRKVPRCPHCDAAMDEEASDEQD